MKISKLIEGLKHYMALAGDLEVHAEDEGSTILLDKISGVVDAKTLEYEYLMLSPAEYEG